MPYYCCFGWLLFLCLAYIFCSSHIIFPCFLFFFFLLRFSAKFVHWSFTFVHCQLLYNDNIDTILCMLQRYNSKQLATKNIIDFEHLSWSIYYHINNINKMQNLKWKPIETDSHQITRNLNTDISQRIWQVTSLSILCLLPSPQFLE